MFRFSGMAAPPPMPPAMLSTATIAACGAQQGVDLQLLGPWTDLFGYTLPEAVAADWARCYNEALASECAAFPATEPMATIPMGYPNRAVAELVAAHELGCRGVMIGTDIPDLHLGSGELEPVWEAAASLSIPVLLHPTFLEVPSELRGAGLKNAVGRAAPTAVALARLIYSGALVRHPSLTVIAAHGGGAFAAVAGRIIRNHELGLSGSDYDPSDSICRLHFDSVVLDPAYLRYLVGRFGADRFLLGSDLPFPWEPEPVGSVRRAALPAAAECAVLGANASRLYGFDRRVAAASDQRSARLADERCC